MKLYNIRLLVGDFPATFAFWRDVMRLSVAFGPESPGAPPGYAYFTVDGAGVELLSRDAFAEALGEAAPAPTPTGRAEVLVFQVDDVDATYAELAGRGVASIVPPRDRPEWGARTLHLTDPDGHLIEIYSPLRAADAPTI